MISLDFKKQGGLAPVIVQDAEDGTVLMLAYMNEPAFRKTLETGLATYWSRSRQELWIKGATSGHTQQVLEVLVDCDLDTILLKVRQNGRSACHEGYRSCFYRRVENGDLKIVEAKISKQKG